MASYDGSIMIETQVDTGGLQKGMNSVNKQAKTMKSSFAGIGKAVVAAFAVKVLVDFGKQAVSLASDLQEVQNVVDVAFGDMADKVEEFAKTSIETMGISELTAKRTASTYMAMGKGMGLAAQDAFNMSLGLTQLSADMASFYNISQERADIALKAVYTGETEVLKQYGIVMTEVNLKQYALSQGITKSLDSMNQQEKTMLRYNYVLQQTQLAQGDFARTSGSWANQTRILSENWKQFMTIVGNGLVKVLTPLVTVLNNIVSGLISFANAIASVFGGQKLDAQETSEAISSSVENQENLTDATKKTNKEAKKTEATFDEIQKLQGQTAEAGGVGAGINTATSSLQVAEFEIKNAEEVQSVNEKLKPFLDTLEKFKEISFDNLSNSFDKLSEAIKPIVDKFLDSLKWFLDEFLQPLSKFTIEEVLPRFFETLSTALESVDTILDELAPIWQNYYDNYLKPLAEYAADKFLDFWDDFNDKIEEAKEWLKDTTMFEDLDRILQAIAKTMKPLVEDLIDFSFWLADLVLDAGALGIKYFFEDIEDIIGAIADLIEGDFDSAWEHLEDLFINNRISMATDALNLFKDKTKEVADELKTRFSKEKMDEAFENIGVAFGNAVAKIIEWDTKIDTWIAENVKPLFTKEKWAEIFGNIKTAMSDTMDKVLEWFTIKKWQEAGKNLYNGLASNINKAIDGIQNLINSAISFFNKIIDGYNSIAEVNPLMNTINRINPINLSKYKIPQLAQGAVIPPNKEFMAILGDQKQGVNIETPLATMIEAFKQAQSQQTGELVADITLDIDGEKLYSQQQRIQLRRGTRLVTGGAF